MTSPSPSPKPNRKRNIQPKISTRAASKPSESGTRKSGRRVDLSVRSRRKRARPSERRRGRRKRPNERVRKRRPKPELRATGRQQPLPLLSLRHAKPGSTTSSASSPTKTGRHHSLAHSLTLHLRHPAAGTPSASGVTNLKFVTTPSKNCSIKTKRISNGSACAWHPDKHLLGKNQVKAQEMFQLIQRILDGSRTAGEE